MKNNASQVTGNPGVLENALLSAPYPIVIFEGLDMTVTYANDALLNLWGKDERIIGQTFLQILPELADQPFPELLRQVYLTGTPSSDKEALAKLIIDGVPQTVFFDYSYTAIRNSQGVIIGVLVICRDVTEQALAKRRLEESKEKFRNTMHQAPFALAILHGEDFIIESANAVCLDIWQRTNEAIGKKALDVFPEFIKQGFYDMLKEVYSKGKSFYANELPVELEKDGKRSTKYLNFIYQPIFENSQVTSIMAVGYDVSDMVISRKNADSKTALLEYLNLAGQELALTINTASALEKISRLIVPHFSDWFTINVLRDDHLDLLMVYNSDQNYVEWAKNYRTKNPITIADKGLMGHVLRTGESFLTPLVTDEMLEASLEDKDQLEVIRKMNLRSSILVPMKVGSEIIGTINFISTIEGREYNEADLNFAKDFGTRIALALQNARLHEQQQSSLQINEGLLKEMEFERNRFEAVVEQMPGAVVIGEAPSGKLIFANQKLKDIWGYSLEDSQSIADYVGWEGFHPDKSPYKPQEWPLARSIKNGEIVTDEDVNIVRSDGKPAVVRLNSAPIRDNEGKIIAGVSIIQDVTVLKDAIRSRDEFLSIASHELKTPLTSLTASIQMLLRLYEKEPVSKSIPGLIDTSQRSAVKLDTLVKELLDVSKIEAGHLKLNRSRFILADVINDCCAHIRLIGTHDLVLQGDLSLEVLADKQRIDQVIVNFVNNAVKYGPDSGEITLLIERVGLNAKLTVIDKGIGIEKVKIPFLFNRFYRVADTGFKYSGLGLGLYICAEIIKLHQGEIGVTSKVGEGSEFWFTIPIG